jgi:hypothetical protein
MVKNVSAVVVAVVVVVVDDDDGDDDDDVEIYQNHLNYLNKIFLKNVIRFDLLILTLFTYELVFA